MKNVTGKLQCNLRNKLKYVNFLRSEDRGIPFLIKANEYEILYCDKDEMLNPLDRLENVNYSQQIKDFIAEDIVLAELLDEALEQLRGLVIGSFSRVILDKIKAI